MRKLILLSGFFASFAFSAPYPDEIAICYLFEGDSLKERSTCILSHGYGAGGDYTNLDFNGQNYLIRGTDNENGDREYKLNDEPVIEEYVRDTGFYSRLVGNHLDVATMFCTRSASLDVCYYLPD